jgi:hypothetical protein
MTTWYIVKFSAITAEKTFENEKDAEREAHKLTCLTGHKWHVEKVLGWDC